MDNRAKFYCWLIGKLERRHMTIQEICNDWGESSSNIDGKELSVRTFHRYREEIANLFGMPTRKYQNGYSAPCAWLRLVTN